MRLTLYLNDLSLDGLHKLKSGKIISLDPQDFEISKIRMRNARTITLCVGLSTYYLKTADRYVNPRWAAI